MEKQYRVYAANTIGNIDRLLDHLENENHVSEVLLTVWNLCRDRENAIHFAKKGLKLIVHCLWYEDASIVHMVVEILYLFCMQDEFKMELSSMTVLTALVELRDLYQDEEINVVVMDILAEIGFLGKDCIDRIEKAHGFTYIVHCANSDLNRLQIASVRALWRMISYPRIEQDAKVIMLFFENAGINRIVQLHKTSNDDTVKGLTYQVLKTIQNIPELAQYLRQAGITL